MAPFTSDDYHIGWICALPEERAAARAMLDEEHPKIQGQDRQDSNSYSLGRIHDHNVVIAVLPASVDGTSAAAAAAINLLRTFKSIRFGLMVGIGGGITNPQNHVDIRLGDVVVSEPQGTLGGVVQYDKGKIEEDEFELKGYLNAPLPHC